MAKTVHYTGDITIRYAFYWVNKVWVLINVTHTAKAQAHTQSALVPRN